MSKNAEQYLFSGIPFFWEELTLRPSKIIGFALGAALLVSLFCGLITWDYSNATDLYLSLVELIMTPAFNYMTGFAESIFERMIESAFK